MSGTRKNHPSRRKPRLEVAIKNCKKILSMNDENLALYRRANNKEALVEVEDLNSYRENLKKTLENTENNLKAIG